MSINITDEQFWTLIQEECAALSELLVEKNRKYGNSILRSPNVFSTTSPLDKINDRLDDKISRIMAGQEDDIEDAEIDIAGYLILRRVVKNLQGGQAPTPKVEEPVAEETPKKPRKRRTKKEIEAEKAAELIEAGASPIVADTVAAAVTEATGDIQVIDPVVSEVLESNQEFLQDSGLSLDLL